MACFGDGQRVPRAMRSATKFVSHVVRKQRDRLSCCASYEAVPPVRTGVSARPDQVRQDDVLRVTGCLFGSLRSKLSFARFALRLLGPLSIET